MRRKSLSKKTRFAVLERDAFACRYCGQSAPDVRLEVDHIVPVSRGGKHTMDNFVTACEPCNSGKAANALSYESADRPGLRPLSSLDHRCIDFSARVAATRWPDSEGDVGLLRYLMTSWHRYLNIPTSLIVDIAMTTPTYLKAYPVMGKYRRDNGLPSAGPPPEFEGEEPHYDA